jgi:DNA (cytosine-5)-methyltransferase 1
MKQPIKYFSMFSGIGGFEYGMEQSDYEFECVGYSEIDKYARSIYEKHFPNHINYGDATRINTEDLPSFEFLVGGFPCQAFSIAGKRKGFDEARGTLFFEIARVLRDKKPARFLLENVKGLLSHDRGRTVQTIFRVCDELGYDVSWAVYNSKDYGVPQNRERIFIKGYFRGKCGREILHKKRDRGKNSAKIDIIGNVYSSGHGSGKVINEKGICPTLIVAGDVPRCMCKPVLTPEREKKRQNGRRMKEDGEEMFTLTAQDKHGIYDGYRIRRLTPVECERLQGFPDDWTKYGKDNEPISDTQRYKCCGNAVTTNVITAIINEMFNEVIESE